MLRKLFAWLSTRFPEKMVLSLQEYKELREEIGQLNVLFQNVNQLHEKLTKLERTVNDLCAAGGFVNTPRGPSRLER
jgi:hypothetical protein